MMVEQALHEGLAVVERAFDGDGVDIVVRRRGHHAPLHFGDAPLREQHHHVHVVASAERLDGSAAGVARRGAYDGGALAALSQEVVHEPRQELHGQVLEGQCGAVEQLRQEAVRAVLDERHHRRVTERVVGLARHAGEIGIPDCPGHEWADHLDRHLGVGSSG
jgi:hypothetical protein